MTARLFLLLVLLLGCDAVRADEPSVESIDRTGFQESAKAFLRTHCIDCHGEDEQNSGFRFDRLTGFAPADRHLWTTIHEQIASGEMPPPEMPRPAAEERERMLDWIADRQAVHRDSGTRRLNRREVAAAFRDLTGLKIDYARTLPFDGTVAGFDTGADGLQDAADSVAKSLAMARRVTESLRFLEPSGAQVFAVDYRDRKAAEREVREWKDRGVSSKGRGRFVDGVGILLDPKWMNERGGFQFYLTPPNGYRGVLQLTLTLSRFDSRHADLPNPHLLVEVGGQDFGYREITATSEDPTTFRYDIQLDGLPIEKRGLSLMLSNRIEIPYAVRGFPNEDRTNGEVKGGASLFRPEYDRKSKLPPEELPVPFLLLHDIELRVDHQAQWPPAAWEADLKPLTDSDETARELLHLWAERAWRRPVEPKELTRYFELSSRLRRDGMDFDGALRIAFQAVLMSGSFRYLLAPDDAETPRMRQFAIASRLSFFLVGAPPDDELKTLAVAGRLTDPKVLANQVDRLLGSPDSERFVEPFVTQWLVLDQPITVVMNSIKQQDFRFGRYLKESMRRETIKYVAAMLRENRPIRELVRSDWAMRNDSLSHFYGDGELTSGEFVRVSLPKTDRRGGGLFAHAGIQSMLTWMGDNWVIYRGAWTLRHLLDRPPPNPPLEVPELDASASENRGLTYREMLARHMEDPNCAVCHTEMDPLGFAFQNFDLSGRWREVEHERYQRAELDGKIEWRGTGETRPVDAVGRLPRGEEFESFAEFRELIAERYADDLTRAFLKNLFIYATGRRPDVADLNEIRGIMDRTRAAGFPLRDLLVGLVQSRAFLGDPQRE